MYEIKYINHTIVIRYIVNDNSICVCECIEIQRTDVSVEKGLYVKSIFTDPSFRNKGYATDMLDFLKKFCQKQNYKYIILDDSSDGTPPNNLYYKLDCLVKKFDKNYNYTWVTWRDNINLSVDEERLFNIF